MKELTIEEKAKIYDEALEKANVAYKDEDRHLKATLERIFPELKESEDEKIRKELISFVRGMLACHNKPNAERDEKYESWIAWLEKQGKEISWKPSNEQIQTLEYYMHTLICNNYKETLFGLYNDLKGLKEK